MSLRYDPALNGWVFETPSGPRVLRDPDGLPTGRQLLALAARGLLELRPLPGERLTKLAAALALDHVSGPERPQARTQADIRADLLGAVLEHPGELWSVTRRRVAGRNSSKRDALDASIISGRIRTTRGRGGGMLLWPRRSAEETA